MISAEQAREKQKQINSERELKQLKEIEDKIHSDITLGYTYHYESLEPNVAKILQSLGYEIQTTFDQRDGNGITVKIKW